MRYAILSDIHANADALRAALVDARDLAAGKIVCLGDVVGYGPDPAAALEEVYAHVHVCLAGNHDDAVCGRRGADDFNDFAAAAVARHRAALTPAALAWLRQLPYVCAFPGFACAHGDLADPPAFDYVSEPEDAVQSFAARPETLLFVGHTHKPGIVVRRPDGSLQALPPTDFRLAEGCRYLVNVGSVGYPRSGACRTTYCLYDDATRTVHFRSLPFDLEGYRAKMGGRGLEEAPWMAARAAQRATAPVRRQASFARPTPARPKPATLSNGAPKRRRSVVPFVLVALLALAAGVALALHFGTRERTVVRTLVRERVVTETVVKKVPVAAAKPVVAEPAGWTGLLTNAVVCLDGSRKVFFAVKLQPKSHPARARLSFRDAAGRPLAGTEIVYPPFATSLSHATAKSAVPAPEGAVEAVLEIASAGGNGFCGLARLDIRSTEPSRRRR